MRLRLHLAGALAALLALAAAAEAAPYTIHFDGLRTELEARDVDPGTTGKQKAAVKKALKALDRNSTSVTTDLKTSATIAKSLSKAFPGDLAIDGLLRNTVDGLRVEVTQDRDTFANLTNDLPDGSVRSKAQRSIESVDAQLVKADASDDAAAKAKLTTVAQLKLDAAKRATLGMQKSGNFLVAVVDGQLFKAKLVSATEFFGFTMLGATPGLRNGQSINLTLTGMPNPGVYPLGSNDTPGEGTYVKGTTGLGGNTWATFGGNPDAPSGTLTITAFDPTRKIVQGSFTFVGRSNDDQTEKSVLSGAFRIDY